MLNFLTFKFFIPLIPSKVSLPVSLAILIGILPLFGIAQVHGDLQIPKIPRNTDHDRLLEDILRERKPYQARKEPSVLIRSEETRVIGFTPDMMKVLLLKKIRVNGKRQQDLVFVDIKKSETQHYRFNNPFLYSRKKRQLIAEHDLVTGTLRGVSIENEMIRHELLPADLLFLREDRTEKGEYTIPGLQICLDNGRERYLLGNIRISQILTRPIEVERMYLGSGGRIALFVINSIYRENNLFYQQQEIIGFDLYRSITDPRLKITAAEEFALNQEQRNLSFQKNFYYNEKNELLYTEILYHSGFKQVRGDDTLY